MYLEYLKENNLIDNESLSVEEYHNLLLQQQEKNTCNKNCNSSFYKILPLLSRYLPYQDLRNCGLIDKKSYHIIILNMIWKQPDFNKLSHIHDALYMFNKFLRYLPTIHVNRLAFIQHLNLSNIEETIYNHVDPNFFRIIVNHCQHLKTLDLSNTQFFNMKSLPKIEHWSLPQLSILDLSNCSQVTDTMIVSIARGCRKLMQVKLDGLHRLKGEGLACLAAECDQLESVSVRHNTSLEDGGLIALAKFRHIHLYELDITGCKKLTSIGLEMLARYAAHLKYFSIADTNCHLSELRRFICIRRRTETLNISSCKNLLKDQLSLATWLWETEFQQLKNVTMDTSIANTMVDLSKNQLVDAYHHVRQVQHLTLVNLPERTPFSYLRSLLILFPIVKTITFERAYFETDFMLGTYRTPSPDTEEYITDSSLKEFNTTQSRVFVSMIHQRESDVNCNLMNW